MNAWNPNHEVVLHQTTTVSVMSISVQIKLFIFTYVQTWAF